MMWDVKPVRSFQRHIEVDSRSKDCKKEQLLLGLDIWEEYECAERTPPIPRHHHFYKGALIGTSQAQLDLADLAATMALRCSLALSLSKNCAVAALSLSLISG